VSYALLQSLVAPALPGIQHALHTSESSVSWVLTAYLLSASVATPLIGRIGDIHGKERVLVIVLALLAVGTLISAQALGDLASLQGRGRRAMRLHVADAEAGLARLDAMVGATLSV